MTSAKGVHRSPFTVHRSPFGVRLVAGPEVSCLHEASKLQRYNANDNSLRTPNAER
ncbi:MAG TPA: hypothetical protein VK768_04385 [Chthoniobacterales bacterium]|nr:hypothetical protein [Chthoniobacterales bacterium]